ncbi:MAG: hypothetical protein JST71_10465 [Bacteroidetes bacterium]|jgi:hypothetical protein|nr:hypothetical protein [Bacteroidota bacterium]MCC7513656.1 hypothetical protein [Bacteroidia bacterium]HMX98126.1 hypothetical protein [Bacteroidia bacterium]HMY14606.1 hypothetical protein [Bacteroidia bacterium]HNB13566.1 hypothetical protein [Bacteroidia bacterium]
MKTKSNVLILLLFCSVSVFGQNLIWNPSVKLNERPYQKFLGTNNGYFYAAGSNIKMIQDISDSIFLTTAWKKLKLTLLRYDDKFILKDTAAIRFLQSPVRVYDVVLSDSTIKVFYSKGIDNLEFCADIFDLRGYFKQTIVLITGKDVVKFNQKSFFNYNTSINKHYFTISTNDSIYCFSNQLNNVWKTVLPNSTFFDGTVNDNGTFSGVFSSGKEHFIATCVDGKVITQTISTEKAELADFKIKHEGNRIIVASLFGFTDNTFNPIYNNIANAKKFKSNGVSISEFNNDLQLIKTNSLKFKDETLLETVDNLLLKNIKGVDFLKIQQIDVMSNGNIMILIEKLFSSYTKPAAVNGKTNTIIGRETSANELLLGCTDMQNKNLQTVIKRKVSATENFEYVCNVKGIPHKDDYYLYFLDGSNPDAYQITQTIFNSELRKIYTKELELASAKKLLPDLSTITRISNSRYILNARLLKKFSTAILDFK